MHFITAENEIITGVFCGQQLEDGAIEIPADSNVYVGDKLSFYNKDWTRKTQVELVKENLIPLEKGMKIVADEIIPMTHVERIEEGIDQLPKGMKIAEGELVAKTDRELYDDGEITKDEYAETVRRERDILIRKTESSNEYKENLRLSRKSDKKAIDYIASADLYIEYLCDIPQSKNFPFEEILSFEDWKK